MLISSPQSANEPCALDLIDDKKQRTFMSSSGVSARDHARTLSDNPLYRSKRTKVFRNTSKITAVDHPNSNTPFIAVMGLSKRQRSTGTTSP
jgi:hypothetical protein